MHATFVHTKISFMRSSDGVAFAWMKIASWPWHLGHTMFFSRVSEGSEMMSSGIFSSWLLRAWRGQGRGSRVVWRRP